MKILGYFLKAISIFFFIVLFFAIFNVISQIGNHLNQGAAFLIGYILGIFLGIFGFGWILYKLYKFGNSLISKAISNQ
jgi:hypothetical protein